jgi:hypothetical protein
LARRRERTTVAHHCQKTTICLEKHILYIEITQMPSMADLAAALLRTKQQQQHRSPPQQQHRQGHHGQHQQL